MNRSLMPILAAGLLALAACDDKTTVTETKPNDPTSKSSTTANATQPAATVAAPAAPVAPAIADSDLSTSADFEEVAERSITKATYKTDLSSLETDISKEM